MFSVWLIAVDMVSSSCIDSPGYAFFSGWIKLHYAYIPYFFYLSPIDGELGWLFNLTHEYGCNKHVYASWHVCVVFWLRVLQVYRGVYSCHMAALLLRTLHVDFLIYLSIVICWPRCLCVGQRATWGRWLSPSTMWSWGPSSGLQSLWKGPAELSAIYSRGWPCSSAPPDAISQVLGSCATQSVSIQCWESNPELPTLGKP